jgi:hypothetical protein
MADPVGAAEAVARRWIELYDDVEPGTYGDGRFFDLYAETCRWREMPSGFFAEGRRSDGGMDRTTLDASAAVFTDRHVDLHDLVASNDSIGMRYTWSARVSADLGPGSPAIGDRLQFEVASFMRVADGKIVDITEVLSAPLPSSYER